MLPLKSPTVSSDSSSDVRLCASYLPPGTANWIPPWCLHRDPRNFSFWPERWLIASGQLRIEDTRFPSSPSPGLAYNSEFSNPTPVEREKRSDAKVDFVHNDGAYIPFSYGPPLTLLHFQSVPSFRHTCTSGASTYFRGAMVVGYKRRM